MAAPKGPSPNRPWRRRSTKRKATAAFKSRSMASGVRPRRCARSSGFSGPLRQDLEQVEAYAGIEHLGVDEARAHIEQGPRPAPCDRPGQGKACGEVTKARAAQKAVAPGQKPVVQAAPSGVAQAASGMRSLGKNDCASLSMSALSSAEPGQGGIDSTALAKSCSSLCLAPLRPNSRAALERPEGNVAAHGLAQKQRIAGGVADVVRHLEGFAQALAQAAPRAALDPCRHGTGDGGGGKQRARLLTLVVRQFAFGLALPGLAGDDPCGHAHRMADDEEEAAQAVGPVGCRPRQGLEGQHDERIARQHGQGLAERHMDRRLAAPCGRIVKAGQIVMDERGAVQQLDGDGRCIGELGRVFPASGSDGEAQAGADAGPSGKHGVADGSGEAGRTARCLGTGDGSVQSLLDPRQGIHA